MKLFDQIVYPSPIGIRKKEDVPEQFFNEPPHIGRNAAGAGIYKTDIYDNLFIKPKTLTDIKQLENKIKSMSKKKTAFHETLLDWYCQTIFDFCKEEYITLNCQKHIFKRL